MTALHFAMFFAMQAGANLCFSYGSRDPSRWLFSFVLENVVGHRASGSRCCATRDANQFRQWL